MKTSNKLLLILLGSLVSIGILAAIYIRFFSGAVGETIEGNGTTISEERQIMGFQNVSLNGTYKLIVSQGPYEVKLTGESNILPFIESSLEGETIKIGYKKGANIKSSKPLEIYLQAPSWKQIQADGNCTVGSSSVLQGSELQILCSGTGKIELKVDYSLISSTLQGAPDLTLTGTAGTFSVSNSGSGVVHAENLKGKAVYYQSTGSGNATLYSDSLLDVQSLGSGDIEYYGHPPVLRSQMRGSGNLNAID